MINIDIVESFQPGYLRSIHDCRFIDEDKARIALVKYTVEAIFGRGTISLFTAESKKKQFVYLVFKDICKDTFTPKPSSDDKPLEINREVRLKFPKTLDGVKSINMCIEDLTSLKAQILSEMKTCVDNPDIGNKSKEEKQ